LPRVTVRTKAGKINGRKLAEVYEGLRAAVAFNLSCEGSILTKDNVHLRHEDGSPYDINTEDVEVTIVTRNKPERMENGDERAKLIGHWLQDQLPRGITYKINIHFTPISTFKWQS